MTFVKFHPGKEFDKTFYGNCGTFYKDFSNFDLDYGFTFSPRVDISEYEDKINFEVELAGVKKEDVKILLEDNVLTVSGEKRDLSQDKKDIKVLRNERYFGNFKRVFRLPDNINADGIEAKFEDGILTISVPKAEVKSQKEKTIEIK